MGFYYSMYRPSASDTAKLVADPSLADWFMFLEEDLDAALTERAKAAGFSREPARASDLDKCWHVIHWALSGRVFPEYDGSPAEYVMDGDVPLDWILDDGGMVGHILKPESVKRFDAFLRQKPVEERIAAVPWADCGDIYLGDIAAGIAEGNADDLAYFREKIGTLYDFVGTAAANGDGMIAIAI